MILIPALMWATTNPMVLGYLVAGTTVGAKVLLGGTIGLLAVHAAGF
ncbi:hypothetical protein [Alicyclobacillus fastidiosus]|uniref:Uncharacterized protein n=1 Tax=Alicyclobacillus fastidiosus TaxID=392011 RepID=A0ABV5AIP8_9BACL|nr:hypothetical protein [Alicyclobacillus fastidiosus]WEH11117.1 hypothetical protein PYS47_07835 [Alicyclobacillus fastidiosus]